MLKQGGPPQSSPGRARNTKVASSLQQLKFKSGPGVSVATQMNYRIKSSLPASCCIYFALEVHNAAEHRTHRGTQRLEPSSSYESLSNCRSHLSHLLNALGHQKEPAATSIKVKAFNIDSLSGRMTVEAHSGACLDLTCPFSREIHLQDILLPWMTGLRSPLRLMEPSGIEVDS
ncbi:hypothetical protein INR49_018463 [Caranx melampygus]|nr:hypothetical protein INR49_018463 [Caranx melampygus]